MEFEAAEMKVEADTLREENATLRQQLESAESKVRVLSSALENAHALEPLRQGDGNDAGVDTPRANNLDDADDVNASGASV